NPPVARLALAGKNLDQLGLAIAGNPGNAEDLARMDLEADAFDGRQPLVVVGEEAGDLEHDRPVGHRLPGGALADARLADHHAAHLVDREVADKAAPGHAPAPQHR